MRKVFITIAPVGHFGLTEVKNPVTPEEVAQAVIESANEGASMAHLHIRDKKGELTGDLSVFSETVRLIRKKSDIIIQGSSGGAPKGGIGELTREERCIALNDPNVEVASLNMGSVNFGADPFINSGYDIEFWADEMHNKKIAAELEIFEGGMIRAVDELLKNGHLRPPYYYAFCVGASLPGNASSLFFLQSMLPKQAVWGINHIGMTDFSLAAVAFGLGSSFMRVGYEDGINYAQGKVAASNSELVTRAAVAIRSLGYELATPKEAREMLGIPPL